MPCETSCCEKLACLLRERHLIFAKIRTNIRAFLFKKRYSHDATALSGFGLLLRCKKRSLDRRRRGWWDKEGVE